MSRAQRRFDPSSYDAKVFDLDAYRVELHRQDCPCPACLPPAPSDPTTLSGDAIGKLAVAGATVGTLIAFAIDARGAWAALRSIVGL